MAKVQVFKFSQLSEEARLVAAQDYIDGTRDDDDEPTIEDGFEGCTDTEDDVFYNKDGVIVDEDTGKIIVE